MTFAEDMQVLRYDYKQHYHVHYDFFDPAMYPGDKRWVSGHNRLATVFFYLTSVEEGGETVFPYANAPVAEHASIHAYGPCEDAVAGSLKVPARQGHAIVFYNMKPDGHLEGKLDKTALHGGCDPIKGQKWAANYWIRNGPVL
jgi:prolyl 4-hydroxylase